MRAKKKRMISEIKWTDNKKKGSTVSKYISLESIKLPKINFKEFWMSHISNSSESLHIISLNLIFF